MEKSAAAIYLAHAQDEVLNNWLVELTDGAEVQHLGRGVKNPEDDEVEDDA